METDREIKKETERKERDEDGEKEDTLEEGKKPFFLRESGGEEAGASGRRGTTQSVRSLWRLRLRPSLAPAPGRGAGAFSAPDVQGCEERGASRKQGRLRHIAM